MKPVNIRAYSTLVQVIILLCVVIALLWFNKAFVVDFFQLTQVGHLGAFLNGLIILLFLIGLARILSMMFSYRHEQSVLNKFLARVRDKVANPTYKLPADALIVRRYNAVQLLAQQGSETDQAALAGVSAAEQASRFTLVRFVNNILILSGVFGTVVSLSVALIGAAGLLDSPENLEKMGAIIGGMSTALSTTITAIVCYVFYSYFHLRLQDTRVRVLSNLEEATTLYIMPNFRSSEGNILHDVSLLTQELRKAAESIGLIQDRFLSAGERLQLAVDDMQRHMVRMVNSGDELRLIRQALREGFRLGESHNSNVVHASSARKDR